MASSARFRNLLVVIKQTAYEEYSQLKLRGQAPKALRWKRLESRYRAHKQCVDDLLNHLRRHRVTFSCVNRVDLDRQHLANVDLLVAVGGDGTVLSAAHFLDHGTIPLLGINSDPISQEDRSVGVKKKSDERRSHGALCMMTANTMTEGLEQVLYGGADWTERTRIHCVVKSTFSETRLVPALNDLLLANPSPAAVSRFRMGWLCKVVDEQVEPQQQQQQESSSSSLPTSQQYGTVTRFGRHAYDVQNSLNVWSSGMWVSTATGSTAAMAAAGGKPMDNHENDLQYLIREHMIEKDANSMHDNKDCMNNGLFKERKMHLRWNSQKGRIFIDGSHLTHNVELGDEILIDSNAPPLKLFTEMEE